MSHELPPPNLAVFTCTHVLEKNEPILFVSHQKDGDWQFLCGEDHAVPSGETAKSVGFEEILEIDPSLDVVVRHLSQNWSARRPAPDADWEIHDHTEDAVRRNIAQRGWHVMGVSGHEDRPGFCYSIGLYERFQHPEILIYGLPVKIMQGVINEIGRRVQAGDCFEADKGYGGILDSYDCFMRQVKEPHYAAHFDYATWFYGSSDYPVLYCVWPDQEGRFPWEDGFNQAIARLQPNLC